MRREKRRAIGCAPYGGRDRILEEIATIETRLAEIGPDGDCAYENAMIRFFHNEVAMRRAWLEGAAHSSC